MPAQSSLSATFRSAERDLLHHSHPVLELTAELCFESGQQSLAAEAVCDYHLSVISSRLRGRTRRTARSFTR